MKRQDIRLLSSFISTYLPLETHCQSVTPVTHDVTDSAPTMDVMRVQMALMITRQFSFEIFMLYDFLINGFGYTLCCCRLSYTPVSGVVAVGVLPVTADALRSVASRLSDTFDSMPVARARSLTPRMLRFTLKSSSDFAPPEALRMPHEKMARSSIFTFLPWSIISLIQRIMAVITPRHIASENPELCSDMCLARALRFIVSSMTGQA